MKVMPVRCGCGGPTICYETRYYGATYSVECSKCGTQTRAFDTPEEAIRAWNKAMGVKRQRRPKDE